MRQKYENERKLEQHILKTYYADAPAHDSLKCTGPSCRMFSLNRKQLSSYGVNLSVPPRWNVRSIPWNVYSIPQDIRSMGRN